MKTPILMNREGVIASQNRHLNRSLYSIPYPVKAIDTATLNTSKSSLEAVLNEGLPIQLLAVDTAIPAEVVSNVVTKVVYRENFALPVILSAVNTDTPLSVKTTVATKLEADVIDSNIYVTTVASTIPSGVMYSTVSSQLSIITHAQQSDIVSVNTSQSILEVK